MKNVRLLTFVLLIGTLVLSACGAAAATPTAAPQSARSPKVDAMPVSFVGIVDSMAGDQWVISGTTVTVDASIVRDGPFHVGDQVKVEGQVHPDGSFTISRVESPTPQEAATLPPVSVDNSNEAISNANTNDANVNDSNINDDSSNGVVNSNDDNSNASNTNDDNGGNTNDDNSNDSNTNDDNGGNSNDDNSNSSNDNGDDNSGQGRGGDDSGGDDNGSGGHGGDDSGVDDNGSGGHGSDD